jgi:hypothetical protein
MHRSLAHVHGEALFDLVAHAKAIDVVKKGED